MGEFSRINIANNARAELDASITDTDTLISVDDATVFADAPIQLTLVDSQGNLEIVEVGNVDETNDDLENVTRGIDGTTAQSWDAGDRIEDRMNKGTYDELVGEEGFESHSDRHESGGADEISHNSLSIDTDDHHVRFSEDEDDSLADIPNRSYTDLTDRSHDNEDHDVNYTDYDSDNFETDFEDKTTDDLTEGEDNEYFKTHGNEDHTEDYTTTEEDVENFSTGGTEGTVPVSQGDGTLQMEEASSAAEIVESESELPENREQGEFFYIVDENQLYIETEGA